MGQITSAKTVNSQSTVPVTSVHRVEADEIQIFYRAAGDADAPVLLLLHGFPTSSFMFRDIILRLADSYRVIAPDLPGFGFTEVPEKRKYTYSFDALAGTVQAFTMGLVSAAWLLVEEHVLAFVFGKDSLLAEIADQVKGHSEGYDILEKEQAQKAHISHPVNPRYGNNRAGGCHEHSTGCKEHDRCDEPS